MGRLLAAVLALLCCAHATAAPLQALDDRELAQVTGRDGLDFAAHIVINNPNLVGAVADSRLSIGFNGGGQDSYIVIKNLRGTVDMFSVGLSAQKMPSGSDAIQIDLPGYVNYTNFGFESLSAQSDPTAPVTNSLGSLNINGTLSLQGSIRIWSH